MSEFKPFGEETKSQEEKIESIPEEVMYEVTAKNIIEGLDKFREQAKDLSKNELYRVLCSVVEHPMDSTTKLNSPKEQFTANTAKIIKDDQFILSVKFLQDEGKTLKDKENKENE